LGITNSFSTLFKQKVNTLLDKYEDPKEALDHSFTWQAVVTAKKITGDAEDEALG
jgi:phage shock protein A